MEQETLDFEVTRTPLPERPTVVLTWWEGRVVSDWVDLNMHSATFPSWQAAIEGVLHPLNLDRVRVKVRA